MESLYQEYFAQRGAAYPYYWQCSTARCGQCTSHVHTNEDARIPYVDFHRWFGFPYGPTADHQKHVTFFELKTVSGSLIQKGYATSCPLSNLHPESALFELNGYLDSVMPYYENIGYLTIYANYSPCNEFDHYCITKMYDFILRHPYLRLDIYFSQLYHTDDDFSAAVWNREALRSLASLWTQVTINPLSGRVWHVLLRRFVKGLSESTLSQPVLPARASADKFNAQQIQLITGITPYFDETSAFVKSCHHKHRDSEPKPPAFHQSLFQPSFQNMSGTMPPLFVPGSVLPPFPMALPLGSQQHPYATSKPKYIVRHERMPLTTREQHD
ncbi:putative C-_U-editing enzyme APOBEC-4 [Ambystoma mexicanum]|uniref:putative C->U-editing enzyme APOBEC-4 n=1 Tax=Ambystoma mexicanum TaxID=8296 RepID=UPI0037E75FE0